MVKKISLAVSAVTLFGFGSLAAAEEFDSALGKFDVSMTATLATDYIWRGQSQTDGKAAIQGSLDVAHESGLYAGIWASNVSGDLVYNTDENGDVTSHGSIEVDYYVGYGFNVTEDIAVDAYYAIFDYPAASSWNSSEVGASVSGYGLTLGYKYGVDDSDHSNYTYAGYDFSLPYDLTLSVGYGITDAKGGSKDYDDYSVALSKTLLGLDMTLAYTDTSMSESECLDWGYSKKDYCDGNLTFSVSKTL